MDIFKSLLVRRSVLCLIYRLRYCISLADPAHPGKYRSAFDIQAN